MTKHKYKLKDQNGEWFVYHAEPYVWSKEIGDKKEYSDFSTEYCGAVEVEELYSEGKLVGHEETV